MSEQDARDPFLGLNEHIKAQARGQIPTWFVLGTVISVTPLQVRADGMDLDKDDLLVAQHLLPGWKEHLAGLEWPLTADLPGAKLTGSCQCALGGGTVEVTQPAATLKGQTTGEAGVTHDRPLAAGERVLLIPNEDRQTYFMIEKLVKP